MAHDTEGPDDAAGLIARLAQVERREVALAGVLRAVAEKRWSRT